MSVESTIVALLQADTNGSTGVADLLTGGIYSKSAIGKMGIDPKNDATSDAYSLTSGRNILQPCVVVRVRGFQPTYQVFDVREKVVSGRGVVECWLYDASGYATIESARDRIYQLLQMVTLANVGFIQFDNRIEGLRDEDLSDAALLRDDYTYTKTIS